MIYALKLPTNWQAVKMETDLRAENDKKKHIEALSNYTEHTHTQAHTYTTIFVAIQVEVGGALFLPPPPLSSVLYI